MLNLYVGFTMRLLLHVLQPSRDSFSIDRRGKTKGSKFLHLLSSLS